MTNVPCTCHHCCMSPNAETQEALAARWLRLIDDGAPQAELDAIVARLDQLERVPA